MFNSFPRLFSCIFFVAVLLTALPTHAQLYNPLSPNSDLTCVYLPNGKTQLARATDAGYSSIGFKRATKQTAKRISKLRKKARQVTRMMKKLKRQQKKGIFSIDLKPKEVKAVSKFYLQGELSSDIPASINDNIEKLDQVRKIFYNEIEYEKELIKLIKKCRKREVPSPGTFETIFVNIMQYDWNAERDSSGGGYVVVFAKVPAFIRNRYSYLCYDHPRQGTRYKGATTDPCYYELLSHKDPDTCNNLIEYNSKGQPEYYLALMEKRNFYFKNRPGAPSFEQAAKAAEANLRTNPIYGWSDSVAYAAVGVNSCNQSVFD
jgi:hypothetical protein